MKLRITKSKNMKEIKELRGKAVMLVKMPSNLSLLNYPRLGEYDNKYIINTRPCEKKGNRFFDLRTGDEIRKTENMLEWPVLTGNVFRYENGQNLLLSRRFADNRVLCLDIDPEEINEVTMIVRPLINRVRKT